MNTDFKPTPLEKILHISLQVMGLLSTVISVPPMVYLLSKDAKAKINHFRWLLFSIVISGLLSDLQLSIVLAPYPLLPHIAFWADGLLVCIHRRAIVYIMALIIFFIFVWVTTMLLAFLFRLTAVIDQRYLSRVKLFGYFSISLCAFNSCISCGILLVTYPSQSRIDAYIIEKVPEMEFILQSPGFIYFTRMDKFYFAIIGMVHVLVCTVFYVAVFVAIFVIINVALLNVRHVMSASTRAMHYMMFKSLVSQMLLPLFSMLLPVLIIAVSIRFGSDGDCVNHQCMLDYLCKNFAKVTYSCCSDRPFLHYSALASLTAQHALHVPVRLALQVTQWTVNSLGSLVPSQQSLFSYPHPSMQISIYFESPEQSRLLDIHIAIHICASASSGDNQQPNVHKEHAIIGDCALLTHYDFMRRTQKYKMTYLAAAGTVDGSGQSAKKSSIVSREIFVVYEP
ncbi:hypothetical protein PRIPAC_81774 [Pristionchus pacificus]|nr:hypothetical protein PRIPAC_81774 [Pristionchus pacificus]|eukprot:PDM79373.1 G protein-coupled receptor [Pristionchus pacificus]